MSQLNSFYLAWTPRLLGVLRIIAGFPVTAHGFGLDGLFGKGWKRG